MFELVMSWLKRNRNQIFPSLSLSLSLPRPIHSASPCLEVSQCCSIHETRKNRVEEVLGSEEGVNEQFGEGFASFCLSPDYRRIS